MTTLLRKQREIEAREQLILDHAGTLLESHGYLGLNLDELAGRVEYAKGTIYSHFSSKEDLLLGVVIRAVEVRAKLFHHASRYPGLTRERCSAVGIADLLLAARQPRAFEMMQLVSTASVWEKTSPDRRSRLQQASRSIFEPVIAIVREAMLNGDIPDRNIAAEHVVMGLFTMSKGAMLVQASPHAFPPSMADAVLASLQDNRHRYLDGVGWKPLWKEHDYASLEANLKTQWFAMPWSEL